MPDFRIAETAPEHRKLRAAGPAAIGLWAMAGAYAMGTTQMTDGWVPAYWVATWPSGKRLAATLVKVGLWKPEERDGLPGYGFHDWLDIQRSAEQVQAEREAALVRRALYSDPELIAAVRARDGDRCRYCARAVSWTNRRGSSGATFDHVIPIPAGGGNTLDNVVVCCRGCNSGKRSRTPEQAGMTLLPPPKSKMDSSKNGSRNGTSSTQEHSKLPIPIPIPVPVPSGGTSGEGSPEPARERQEPPPPRCPRHANADGDPGPCRACGDARQAREAWDADAGRREAARRSVEAREAAELRVRAIAACDRCDDRGYRGKTLCDHDPDAEARHARGSAAARAELDAALTNVRERRRNETPPAVEEDRHADA